MASVAGSRSQGDIEMKTVPEMLRDCAKLYEERNAVYGDNYKHFGTIITGLFPEGCGIELSTEEDWNRFGIIVQIASKLSRYCVNFKNGGHDDSLQDLAVYATMLRELDAEALAATPSSGTQSVGGTVTDLSQKYDNSPILDRKTWL